MKKNGFTLIELLIVTVIIGFLSTVGTVSYNFARVKSRDTKRVADIRTLHQAVELYYDRYDAYPSSPGGDVLLGSEQAKVLSSLGFTAAGQGQEPIFVENMPFNPVPGGVPYVYRALNEDGSTCFRACQHYDLTFSLETSVGNYASGFHKLTDGGVKGAEGGYTNLESPSFIQTYLPNADDLSYALGGTKDAVAGAQKVLGQTGVQAANTFVAPASIVATAANFAAVLVSVVPAANAGQILLTLMTQPLFFLNRKKRRTWGTVYDAATKVPVDLASVRLIDAASNRSVGTKVTDKDGRYAFSARRGSYRIEVSKLGYVFPAVSLAGATDDANYPDIYHGTLVKVDADGQPVTVNIPLDAEAGVADARQLLSQQNKKSLKRALAMSGPVIGAASLIVTPSSFTLLLFLSHLLVYFGFKRLTEPKVPKNQGIIYDEETRDPVSKAVIRIFSLPYHKVLESRITDARGRYSFYVGNGMYYLTVTKPGFEKTETDPIDFTKVDKPTFIASDLPLRKIAPQSPDAST